MVQHNRTALVTGASRGIGRATALALAETRAAEASKEAEEERIARVKIEARMAARRVTGEQKKQLVAVLQVTGRPGIAVISSFGFPETDDFAEDIAKALLDCGFSVQLTKGAVLIFPVPRPFSISFGINRKHDADSIDAAMIKAGIANKHIDFLPLASEPDALRFWVGPKPE